jgi:hypothetical protein
MGLLRALFPPYYRKLPGKRWINIFLRTLHLIGTAGIGGAYLLGSAPPGWLYFLWLTLASGIAMMAIEVWGNGVWLVQVRGVAILAKLALLVAMPLFPDSAAAIFTLVIVVSAAGAHAPGRLRHYSLLHGREVDVFPRGDDQRT